MAGNTPDDAVAVETSAIREAIVSQRNTPTTEDEKRVAEQAAAGTLFNAQVVDWLNRVTTFVNYLAVVSGGVLSITIGAFISATPPRLDTSGVDFIRLGWYLLSASLIFALLTSFVHIVLHDRVIARMKKLIFGPKSGIAKLQLVEGPRWQKAIIWAAFTLSFVCCVAGIATISIGAGRLLHASAS